MSKEKQIEDYVDLLMAKYWDDFLETNEFAPASAIDDDIKQSMYQLVQGFLGVLMYPKTKPFSQITADDIQTAIERLDEAIPADEAYDDTWETYMQVTQVFLEWLMAKKIINLTDKQLDGVYQKALSGLPAPELGEEYADLDRKLYHYDKPDLPAYDLNEADKIYSQVGQAAEQFVDTGGLQSIYDVVTPDIEDETISNIADLATHIYGEYRLTPDKWTGQAVQEVLKGYFVSDALIQPEMFHYLSPTLRKFMDYAETVSLIPKEVARSVGNAIDEIMPEVNRLGANEANFSPEKTKMLSMLAETDGLTFDESEAYLQDELDSISEGQEKVISLEDWHKKKNKRKKKKKKK